MSTVEKDPEVGWARSGQDAADEAETEALLREAEQTFDRGDYLIAADILHGLRAGTCGERADRLVERIHATLRDPDLARFNHALRSGADAGLPRTATSVSWFTQALFLGLLIWFGGGIAWLAVRGGVLSSCVDRPVGWTESPGPRLRLPSSAWCCGWSEGLPLRGFQRGKPG